MPFCTQIHLLNWANCAGAPGGEGKKGFVPPFVQKAMAGPEEQDNASRFSPKTLELLAGLQPQSISLGLVPDIFPVA